MPTEFAILLPAYDEEKTIRRVIEEFIKAELPAHLHVIVNGATDATLTVARAARAELPEKITVHELPRPGKGAAMRWGFENIEASLFGLIDADASYVMNEFHRLLDVFDEGIDMVIGDRMSAGNYEAHHGPNLRWCGNWFSSFCLRAATGRRLSDVLSGQRIISARALRTIELQSDGFEVETELAWEFARKGLGVRSLPIEYRGRPDENTSHLRVLRDGSAILVMTLHRALTWGQQSHLRALSPSGTNG